MLQMKYLSMVSFGANEFYSRSAFYQLAHLGQIPEVRLVLATDNVEFFAGAFAWHRVDPYIGR